MTTLYGIKNCDTVKKARRWLEQNGVDFQFHDVRIDGITRKQIEQWFSQCDWQNIVNKRSTTWKQLDDNQKTDLDANKALALLLEHPTLIKRPVLATGNTLVVGFKADDYSTLFQTT